MCDWSLRRLLISGCSVAPFSTFAVRCPLACSLLAGCCSPFLPPWKTCRRSAHGRDGIIITFTSTATAIAIMTITTTTAGVGLGWLMPELAADSLMVALCGVLSFLNGYIKTWIFGHAEVRTDAAARHHSCCRRPPPPAARLPLPPRLINA